MDRDEARELFSEYVEGTLDAGRRDAVQACLARNPDAAAELMAFERTLATLHRLPPREPSLDMWQEFAPKLAEWQAERRLGLWQRLRLNWLDLMAQFSAGVILWTHALAGRSHARWGRYLTHDPLTGAHADGQSEAGR